MRSKLILVIALIMGSITTFLFFNYMKKFDEAKIANQNMTEVIVANGKIQENERITSSKVKVIKIPSKGLHSQSIKNTNEVVGKYATAEIESGEVLLGHRIKSSKDELVFVSRKIKEGYRGVSVGVNFIQSVSNLIEPGDTVDVISTEVIKDGNRNIVRTVQILSKVNVLAVGRKMVTVKGKEEEEKYAEYSSVTLELLPDDAIKVVNFSERGNIQLTVHSKITNAAGSTKTTDSMKE
ncbi:MAG: cpaB [Bacillales bacterium]|nr:cpaB [Bacillales bacterium]